jgi:hypothetical protein
MRIFRETPGKVVNMPLMFVHFPPRFPLILTAILVLFLAPGTGGGGQYSQPGFYTPEVLTLANGLTEVGATVDIERMAEVRELIEAELERLRAGQVAAGEVDKSRRQILLALASGYESNSTYADYYAGALGELQGLGQFRNYEDSIAAVTTARVAKVAARYLPRNRTITVLSTPTSTIEGLMRLAGLAIFGTLVIGGILYLRRRKLRRLV